MQNLTQEIAESVEHRAARRKTYSSPFSGSNFDNAFLRPFTPNIRIEKENRYNFEIR